MATLFLTGSGTLETTVSRVWCSLGISARNNYRWNSVFGNSKLAPVECLNELAKKIGRLKQEITDLPHDKGFLHEALEGIKRTIIADL